MMRRPPRSTCTDTPFTYTSLCRSKMPVRAQPVIPALADRLALPARAGEADRPADTRGQGSVQRREHGGHARRHPVEPAFPLALFPTFSSLQIALRAAGCGPRSRVPAAPPARAGGGARTTTG